MTPHFLSITTLFLLHVARHTSAWEVWACVLGHAIFLKIIDLWTSTELCHGTSAAASVAGKSCFLVM